jgi:hypothetical protein
MNRLLLAARRLDSNLGQSRSKISLARFGERMLCFTTSPLGELCRKMVWLSMYHGAIPHSNMAVCFVRLTKDIRIDDSVERPSRIGSNARGGQTSMKKHQRNVSRSGDALESG